MINTLPKSKKRNAFTLVELVVVVLILGIIAAIATPKMFDTASDARDNASKQSLTVLREAIELYRAKNGSFPAAATISTQLADYLKGPFPAPHVGSKTATVGASTADPLAVKTGGDGWVYNETSGDIAINHADYISW
ncbi:Type II secretion system protein G precursor [Polystyrenella longa]|uniref:Type II secretion system protein G n=1 Tax=Polystyrenella longa TaxID=2528007 RepID=A0A518CRQ4_9PLAN|nr:prepilin-type N-terminal cleavage/methylation domain-containing protein [Polystyrenella longa]QDU81895.1 Type II secretion system protein G precursor [Polystyrenella longa]